MNFDLERAATGAITGYIFGGPVGAAVLGAAGALASPAASSTLLPPRGDSIARTTDSRS